MLVSSLMSYALQEQTDSARPTAYMDGFSQGRCSIDGVKGRKKSVDWTTCFSFQDARYLPILWQIFGCLDTR